MKYLLVITFQFVLVLSVLGQAPYAFNFQAVARDSEGAAITEKFIALRISITEGHEEGNIVFSEEHEVTTNERGLFTLQIGAGFPVLGNLRTIDWGQNLYFVRTEVDLEGGSDFEELGSAQLYSVPYALYAIEAGNATGGSGSTPTLLFNNDLLFIEGGNSVDLSDLRNDDDADPFNELQDLSISGNQLSISNGNTISLPSTGGGSDNQRLIFDGVNLSIQNGNSVDLSSLQDGFIDADADPSNELQSLSLSGNTLSISDGNSITLPVSGSATDSPWDRISSSRIHFPGEEVSTGNENDNPAVRIGVSDDQSGIIQVRGAPLRENVDIQYISDSGVYFIDEEGRFSFILTNNSSENFGALALYNEGKLSISNTVTTSDAGFTRYRGPNEEDNIRMSVLSNNPNNGFLAICGPDGEAKARSYVTADNYGIVSTTGPNGNPNIAMTALNNRENHGYLAVYDASGNEEAGIYVDQQGRGVVFADIKNFKAQHPNSIDHEIYYASIEGPEAAMYVRGTSKLKKGRAEVTLPDHFSSMADKDGITVMLTPLSASCKGLAVTSKTPYTFVVEELWEGNGTYEFDWEVKAVRSAFKDFQVVRPKGLLKSNNKWKEERESKQITTSHLRK